MMRCLFAAAVAFVAVLFVATIAFWVRSHQACDAYIAQVSATRQWSMLSDDGYLWLTAVTLMPNPPAGWTSTFTESPGYRKSDPTDVNPWSFAKPGLFGFGHRHLSMPFGTIGTIGVPYWSLLALLAIVPAIWVGWRRARRARRRPTGGFEPLPAPSGTES